MTFEEAKAMYELYCINPELTCTCDDLHICQQCMEEKQKGSDILRIPEQEDKLFKHNSTKDTTVSYQRILSVTQ